MQLEVSIAVEAEGMRPWGDALAAWLDDRRWWIWGLILLIYLAGFNGQWRVNPDTAMHAVVGRNLAEGRGYSHPLDHQQTINPGTAVLIAGTYGLFGSNDFLATHLLMLGLGLGALGLVYALVRTHFDRPTAVTVTTLVALTERFYTYAFELMPDLPFAVGLLLFLLGYEIVMLGRPRRWVGWLAMVGGVAVMALFRSVVLVFLAAMLLTMLWHLVRGPNRLRYGIIVGLALAALVVVRYADPRLGEPDELVPDEQIAQDTLSQPLSQLLERIDEHNLPLLFEREAPEAFFGIEFGPYLDTLASASAIVLGLMLVIHRPLWGMVILAFVGQMLVFYFVAARYFLPIIPLVALAWWLASADLSRRLPHPWGAAAMTGMLVLWALPNAVRVGAFALEQRSGQFLTDYRGGGYSGLPELGRLVEERTPPDAMLLLRGTKYVEPVTYYTRRKTNSIGKVERDRLGPHVYYVDQTGDLPTGRFRNLRLTLGEVVCTIDRGAEGPPWVMYEMVPRPSKRGKRGADGTRE